MSRIDVPVLIVGGGGAGLTASMLLSQLGVETLLVCALPTAQGAILVRPDRLVAWRSAGAAAHPASEPGAVLSKVLCRD